MFRNGARGLKEGIRRFLPSARADHRIRGGPLRGHRIHTSWHDYPGAILGRTERPLLEWFGRNVLPGETWLDIGAHYGYTALALCGLVGPLGRVVAFEPVRSTAACLARTRELNRLSQLVVVPFGLSDAAAPVTSLPLTRGMADSTLCEVDRKEQVEMVSFDEVSGSIDVPHVDGIKIDVQGMETRVVRGMLGMLRRDRPKLVVEFHRGVDRSELIALLELCGYSAKAETIDPAASSPPFLDDTSYAFYPSG